MTAGLPEFARFVAIDWSGARGQRYAGVAIAECEPGDAPPRPVDPPAGWWSRTAAVEWLLGLLERGPALVGIDCAFSLPFAVSRHYFADPESATAFDLWELIDRVSALEPDYGGSPFVEHPDYGADFWRAGLQPDWFRDPHRLAERACRSDGLGSPQSPYKLIGSKQVGKGALAGMRVLRALKAAAPDRIAVWPFEVPAPGRTILAEIYPRLFLKRTGFGGRKIRDGGDLDAALAGLDSRPLGLAGAVSDHAADALVSAAGLRHLADVPAAWAPEDMDALARRMEGWIFGVGGWR